MQKPLNLREIQIYSYCCEDITVTMGCRCNFLAFFFSLSLSIFFFWRIDWFFFKGGVGERVFYFLNADGFLFLRGERISCIPAFFFNSFTLFIYLLWRERSFFFSFLSFYFWKGGERGTWQEEGGMVSSSGFHVQDFVLHLNCGQFAAVALILLGGPMHLPAMETARASLGERFATQLTFIWPLTCKQLINRWEINICKTALTHCSHLHGCSPVRNWSTGER